MKIIIDDILLKYDKHRSLIYAHANPNLVGRLFKVKPVVILFIGHGTTWETYPEYKPVSENIRIQLMQVEKRWQHVRRMNPRANFKELAKELNKLL